MRSQSIHNSQQFLRSLRLVSIVLTILAMPVQADQADLDGAIDFGKTLMPNVKDIATTTDPATVPGFQGTNLPETNYYTKDPDEMEADARQGITDGTASEAAIFAHDQATTPKLIFPSNDPILETAKTAGQAALLNPSVLSVPTGSCDVVDQTGTETTTEHCTAWMTPSQHKCNNTLNVDVRWEENSNCPLGTAFNQVSSVHGDPRDHTYARTYCNPGVGDDLVSLQVYADGADGACDGWRDINVSTNQATLKYTGATQRPNWHGECAVVPSFIQGSCNGLDCDYTTSFYRLGSWVRTGGGKGGNPIKYVCGNPVNLSALGYADPLGNYSKRGDLHCVISTSSINLKFIKPNLVRNPIVTETWNNACSQFEAQVQ